MAPSVASVPSHPSLEAVAARVPGPLPLRRHPCRAPAPRTRPCRARGAACDPRHALAVFWPETCAAPHGAPARHPRRQATDAPEAGLLRRDRPCDLPPSPRERLRAPFRRAAEPPGAPQVVSVSTAPRLAAAVGLAHGFTPPVQRLLPRPVGSPGREDAAWRDAGARVDHPAGRRQPPGVPPLPDPAEQGPGIKAPAPQLQPPVMGPVVDTAVDGGLHPLAIPPVWPGNGPVVARLPRPTCRPVPSTTAQHRLRLERLQDAGPGGLEAFRREPREAERPLGAVALRKGATTHQRRPIPLLRQPRHHGRDSRLPGRCLRVPRHAIHPPGRLLVQDAPAGHQALDVQAAAEVSTPGPLVGVRLVCSPPPGGWRACCRAAQVRRTWPGRAASCRHVRPQVRGVPTRGVLCGRRRPRGVRRAFPLTVLLRRPDGLFPSPRRVRQRAGAGGPLPCRKSRLPAANASPRRSLWGRPRSSPARFRPAAA
jgi:hypothetical protein